MKGNYFRIIFASFNLFIALSIFVDLPQAKANQYILYATDSATQNDAGTTVYYGAPGDWMKIRSIPNNQGGDGFVKFDLSGIPDGSVIDSATLYLGLNSLHELPADVGIYYGSNDAWSLTQLDNPIGYDPALHLGNFLIDTQIGWQFIPVALDLTVYDFQSDIIDNELTLAIVADDILSNYFLYMYIWGVNDLTWRPYLVIDATPPVLPDIKANGSDALLTINQGDLLTITISLDPGIMDGIDADFWVWADTATETYWYTQGVGWTLSLSPIRAYEGPLFTLAPYTIYNKTTLPVGSYTVYFSVDDNMDTIKDDTYLDSVTVTIQ